MFNTIQEFIDYIFSVKYEETTNPFQIQPYPRGKYSYCDLVRFIRSLTKEEQMYLWGVDIPNELDRIYYTENDPCSEDVGVGGEEELKLLEDYPFALSVYQILEDTLVSKKSQNKDLNLPPELDTDRARKYFRRAIDLGYMHQVQDGYRWTHGGNRCKVILGYFVEKVYCPTNTERLDEKSINKLFKVNRISSAITQRYNAKKTQPWIFGINQKIFFD